MGHRLLLCSMLTKYKTSAKPCCTTATPAPRQPCAGNACGAAAASQTGACGCYASTEVLFCGAVAVTFSARLLTSPTPRHTAKIPCKVACELREHAGAGYAYMVLAMAAASAKFHASMHHGHMLY